MTTTKRHCDHRVGATQTDKQRLIKNELVELPTAKEVEVIAADRRDDRRKSRHREQA